MNNATPGMKNDQSKIKETNCKLAALKKKDQQTQSEDKSETDQFSPYSFQVLEGKMAPVGLERAPTASQKNFSMSIGPFFFQEIEF